MQPELIEELRNNEFTNYTEILLKASNKGRKKEVKMRIIITMLIILMAGCATNYNCSESMNDVINANGYPDDILAHDEGPYHQRSYEK